MSAVGMLCQATRSPTSWPTQLDEEKIKRSDYVLETSGSLDQRYQTRAQGYEVLWESCEKRRVKAKA